jgi:hypothetical protein
MQKTHAGLVEDYRLYEIHGIRLEQHLVRYLKKYSELEIAHRTLGQYLEVIKAEIERRTPESSQTIAGGRPDAFQTSIFDRTSSSSDTGPETPGHLDRIYSGGFNWGIEPDKSQLESPVSLTHDTPYTRPADIRQPRNYLQLPEAEDDGYDSDREGSTTMTVQPSQQTAHPPQTPMSPGAPWETVQPRRSKRLGRLDIHRTVNRLEKNKYSDRAGSFRAVIAVDPRLSIETAQGYVQRSSSRAQSRGRMSGQSHAEVALTSIHKTSPPPARGGGMIQDRRSSSQRAERGRMTAGTASYAAAVAGPTRDTIPGFTEILRPATEPLHDSHSSTSTLEARSQSSAVESLQRFPIEVNRQPASPVVPLTLMPPYPPTPGSTTGLAYQQPYPSSDTALYNIPGRYSQENLHLGPDPFPSNIYPRMPGTVPVKTRDTSTSPLKRSLPHDYPVWHSQQYSDSMPSSMYLPPQPQSQTPNLHHLSLSSPNIQRPHSNSSPRPSTYYPGHPELSFSSPPNQNDGGYTSQPMSRDPSGQSNHSAGAVEQDRGRRRPSLAETEPLPQLPTFSPRIPPTSYQVYERMHEREVDELRRLERGRSPGYPVRKSPRLGNARAALIERLDSEGIGGVEK